MAIEKRNYRGDPYKKVRYCDPGACHCCEARGGGNFYCRFLKTMVVENWQNTEKAFGCKNQSTNGGASNG